MCNVLERQSSESATIENFKTTRARQNLLSRAFKPIGKTMDYFAKTYSARKANGP